ncbi:MAG: nitroreductase family protein, partial [Chloroflexota bacterium]
MNVAEALERRYTCRAFKPDPVSRETITSILKVALRSPSWANTQPWELFVAGGKALERIRTGYLENFRKGVPRNPDLSPPPCWPPALQGRIEQLGMKRMEALGIDPADNVAKRAMAEQNFGLFGA